MKAKRLILALAATTVLASCGKGKEIKQEEAQDVAKNIAKKVNEADFKNPEKIQLIISMEEKDGDKVIKSSGEVNYSKPDYFFSFVMKHDGDSVGGYRYWDKDEKLLYTVMDETEDGERDFVYSTVSCEADKIDAMFAGQTKVQEGSYNMDFSAIGQLAGVVAQGMTASGSASIDIGGYGASVETHYFSSGEGNLVVEASSTVKAGEKSVTSKSSIWIENYLLTKLTSDDGEGNKLNFEIRYGRANVAKPNLKDASKTEID